MSKTNSSEKSEWGELLRPQDAARRMGISYPTLKQWIYKKKVRAARTAGGHYRIPASEVERLSRIMTAPSTGKKPTGVQAISARNKLLGQVVEFKMDGLLAQVTIDIGGNYVTSLMTRDACVELGLGIGARAFALFKATEVMMIRA